uniref:Glycosyl transferase family 25 domain-containing protein n=1 Tax=Aureoumbra lagunensis TaxID=44058 RepID=A0A6S8B161_9STRA
MYGAIALQNTKETEVGHILRRSLVWKVALATTLSLLMASISSWRMIADDKKNIKNPAALNEKRIESWSCDDFDDDTTITPSECGNVDREMCGYNCISDWCQSMCGDMCSAGEGALCAYTKLSNLQDTCAQVESELLKKGKSLVEELEIESNQKRVYEAACLRLSRDNLSAHAKYDPLNSQGFPICDHHAFCGFCAQSQECTQIVPKVPSPTRIESGGCAAAALGRIVSICDEFAYFSSALYAKASDANIIREQQNKNERLRKIFYINCDNDIERRNFQESQLERIGIPYERFACVSGDSFEQVFASRGNITKRFASKPLRNIREGAPDDTEAHIIRAHTIGVWLSHYLLFELIASYANDKDKEGIYLILEDDALIPPEITAGDIDRAAASLPKDWAYASLNVHESICLEDKVNEDWFVKRGLTNASLFGSERVALGTCTPIQIDNQWQDPNILYLSAAAQLLRPSTAAHVTHWLDGLPIYHIDALLRTPSGAHLRSFQFKNNLISTATNLGETRRGHIFSSQNDHRLLRRRN